jgi:hypothetical protein
MLDRGNVPYIIYSTIDYSIIEYDDYQISQNHPGIYPVGFAERSTQPWICPV